MNPGKTTMPKCDWHGECKKDVTVAVRTVRTKKGLRTVVEWFEESGPASAQRFCGEHAEELLVDLARTLAGEPS